MFPTAAEAFAIIYNCIILHVIPAALFLVALYFVIRKAVRDAMKK